MERYFSDGVYVPLIDNVKARRPIPVRYVLAIGVASACLCLAIALHYEATNAPPNDGRMIGAPPPPPESFVEAFLVIPGILAGLPLSLAGALFEREWLAQTGLILGATVFWYCIGWHIDLVRGAVGTESPPRLMRWYISASVTTSMVLFPICALVGTRVGVHYCANGVPPYWAELLDYGILMFWITIGTYLGWLRWRAKREQRYASPP